MGWPQGLAFSCAGMSASVTILAVICTADLCGLITTLEDSLLCSFLAQLSFVDHSFGTSLLCRLFLQDPHQPLMAPQHLPSSSIDDEFNGYSLSMKNI